MVEEYEWIIGLQASFSPVDKTDDRGRLTGEVIEVRDDSPWPDEQHCRIVLDTGDGVYDVAKERVSLD